MAPPFPRSGPGEPGSPMSPVLRRRYDFPHPHLRSLIGFASGVHAPLLLRVRRSAPGPSEARPGQVPCSAGGPSAGVASHGRRGISQVPRRSIPSLCAAPRPRPNRRTLAISRSRRCCPRSEKNEGFGGRVFRGLPLRFRTRCLRFEDAVASAQAKLASGWLARLCRQGVEPRGSLRKVSDRLHAHPPLLSFS